MTVTKDFKLTLDGPGDAQTRVGDWARSRTVHQATISIWGSDISPFDDTVFSVTNPVQLHLER